MEGDGAPAGRVVHENGERTLVVLKYVFPGGAAPHHLPRPPVIRHGEVGVDQAVVPCLSCYTGNIGRYFIPAAHNNNILNNGFDYRL